MLVDGETLGLLCGGRSDRRMRQLSDQGVFPKIKANTFDAIVCVPAFWNWKFRATSAGDDAKIDGEYERARKDRELADRTALQNAVTRGELISAADAEAAWTAMQANARERLLAMPAKLSDRCAISNSASECYGLIEDEVHTALDELADAAVYAAESNSTEGDNDTGHES